MLTDIRDRVLLVKASPEDSGRWFLPGGGVRFGEDPEAGLRREVEEETGQIVADLELTRVLSDVSKHKGAGLHSIRLIYRATLAEQRPMCNEAPGGSTVEVRWVPLEMVADLETAPFVPLALYGYVRKVGLACRSSGLRHASGQPTTRSLEQDYVESWAEWENNGQEIDWSVGTSDGFSDS